MCAYLQGYTDMLDLLFSVDAHKNLLLVFIT